MCRALGSAYYDLLYVAEKQLRTLLEKCRTKLKDVQNRIDTVRNKSSSVSRNNWYYMFGMPYFKDRRYFPCPPNEDHLRKLANKELCIIDLPVLRHWKNCYIEKLADAIKSEEINKQLKENSYKGLENNVTNLKNMTLKQLVGSRKSEYDWMKISVQVMGGYHSPEECRAMWHHFLNPMIRKGKWSPEEEKTLVELVELFGNQNWDEIAEQLGTGRSGYQCMCTYQSRLNVQRRNSKWSKVEDECLKQAVESCRVGSYIPWAKVTSMIEGRSKNQVFNRWAYSLDPNIKKGKFTEQEDILIVAAVRRYGTGNFKRVARFIPGRTSIQVRDRYNSYLKFQSTGQGWTQEEDTALMALVEEHGEGKWSTISNHFNNRTRSQLRHRYVTIQNWMKKMETSNGEMFVPTRKLSIEDNREAKMWNRVQSILRGMKSSLEMNESNLLKLKKKLNLGNRKRPGRKFGQKKVKSKIEKEYYNFFRCVYTQSGGRRKRQYDNEETVNIAQTVKIMLRHFEARIALSDNNYEIQEERLLDGTDRVILSSLRNELLPARSTKSGQIQSEVSANIGVPHMPQDSGLINVVATETRGSVWLADGQNKCDKLTSSISSFGPNAVIEPSGFPKIIVINSGTTELKKLCKDPLAMTSTTINTVSSSTQLFELRGVELKHNLLSFNSTFSNQILNFAKNQNVVIDSPVTSATFQTTSNALVEYSAVNRNPVKIPYLCPPNHTTLVGFRTLLLSRRIIRAFASNDVLCNKPFSEEADPGTISPSAADKLWKERFTSLFFWPAVMADVVPLMMDQVFKNEYVVNSETDFNEGEASTSGNVFKTPKKPKKYVGKKRKSNLPKKKEVKNAPPVKKRKYEQSGRYKRPVKLEGPVRRSARRSNAENEFNTTHDLKMDNVHLTHVKTDSLNLADVKMEF
ncbi:hypothetical protein L9F63_011750 [Diploptera punctata]|uniref:snRNA-activating protein complex subunit 4 n=1 Tax=Diploptera punctata TaxID=6984 RepID=A0AAD8AEZ1_DIPPU|nr:hypothetical protein L9F63_011750 [Diploptera punctata]